MPTRRPSALDLQVMQQHLSDQAGVITRHQLLTAGASRADVRRLLARGTLHRRVPGIYTDHNGVLTWLQRAWVGVLHFEPAALDLDSALRAANGPGWRGRKDAAPIQVAVDTSRRLGVTPPGFVVRRVAGFRAKVLWNTSPPRMRPEHAALDSALKAAAAADRVEALARAVRSRFTTADRLLEALASRARVPDRAELVAILRDVRDGTASVLEHGYLVNVERAHGLPTAARQVRETAAATVYRDVGYVDFGLVIELDGRLDHLDGAARSSDLDRDLELTRSGRLGVRLGWGQVFDTPCATAEKIAHILVQRGWTGRPTRCGPDCALIWPPPAHSPE